MEHSQFSDKVRVRSCAIVVQESSILLAKINSPTRPHPIWMPPGGGVEVGESLQEALIREVYEETNLKIGMKRLLWVHEFIENLYHAIEFYFQCEVIGGSLKKGVDPELQEDHQMLMELSFVPFAEVKNLLVEPFFIKKFCKTGGHFHSEFQFIHKSTLNRVDSGDQNAMD